MFAKSTVNGNCTETDPSACSATSKLCCPYNNQIYSYLKSIFPGPTLWNFGKFLVNQAGIPVKRYIPTDSPDSILPDIQKLLDGAWTDNDTDPALRGFAGRR